MTFAPLAVPPDLVPTPCTRVKRQTTRARYDRKTVYGILDGGLMCHVGYVIALGDVEKITEPAAKLAALEAFSERITPGRRAELRPPNAREPKATTVMSLCLDRVSAKTARRPAHR